ncbi:MAG: SoxR reducing system RseC family protein [Gammaproteobacteria bacterium AqS3]|nr:SoxR reducing system RseC family protein [Gammaproteobacteria bacterium AqS3]
MTDPRIRIQQIEETQAETLDRKAQPGAAGALVYAEVLEIRDGLARVRASSCPTCASCTCGALTRWSRPPESTLWMPSAPDWSAGERLCLRLERPTSAAALLYGAPLASFLAGVLICAAANAAEPITLLAGLAAVPVGAVLGRLASERLIRRIGISRLESGSF